MGPLPPPEMLKRYEEAHPGAAGIILQEFVAQAEHRRDLESKSLDAAVRGAARGQYCAFLLLLLVIVGGFVLVHSGRDVGGLGVVVTALASAIIVFVKSRNNRVASLRERRASP